MSPDPIIVAATVIMLLPMGYFLLSSPAFLLVKLDIPQVTHLLRGVFKAYFVTMSITSIIATMAFATAGHPAFASAIALVAATAILARPWFLARMDQLISARDAGDPNATTQLRRMHWEGMLSNATLVAATIATIPYVT